MAKTNLIGAALEKKNSRQGHCKELENRNHKTHNKTDCHILKRSRTHGKGGGGKYKSGHRYLDKKSRNGHSRKLNAIAREVVKTYIEETKK